MVFDRQNPYHVSLITLFPQMFPGPLGQSVAARAHDKGLWKLDAIALRDFGVGSHRQVDDTPAGGGAGMVLKADVLAASIDHTCGSNDNRPKLLMSPRGKVLTQSMVRDFADQPGVVIICGRFEELMSG